MAPISITPKHFRSLSRSARILCLKHPQSFKISLPKHHASFIKKIEMYISRLSGARTALQTIQTIKHTHEVTKLLALSASLTNLLSRLNPRVLAENLPKTAKRDSWAYSNLVHARLEQRRCLRAVKRCYRMHFGHLDLKQVMRIGRLINAGRSGEARRLLDPNHESNGCNGNEAANAEGSMVEVKVEISETDDEGSDIHTDVELPDAVSETAAGSLVNNKNISTIRKFLGDGLRLTANGRIDRSTSPESSDGQDSKDSDGTEKAIEPPFNFPTYTAAAREFDSEEETSSSGDSSMINAQLASEMHY